MKKSDIEAASAICIVAGLAGLAVANRGAILAHPYVGEARTMVAAAAAAARAAALKTAEGAILDAAARHVSHYAVA